MIPLYKIVFSEVSPTSLSTVLSIVALSRDNRAYAVNPVGRLSPELRTFIPFPPKEAILALLL
jgi:hypothetical protein